MMYSDKYSISLMCDVFNISRASFYHFFYYSNNDKKDEEKAKLLIRISKIFYDSKRIYGVLRITKILRKEGHNISIKTVFNI